jgi:hypothetical protein
MIIFFILLLILAIIINIIITNSVNENFSNSPDKLIYLFSNECPNCKNFNDTWITIENEVKANPFYYNFITYKYNMEFDSQGIILARDNKLNTPPEIIYISGEKYNIYKEKSTDMESVLNWAKKINGE